jgi:hypothetical protein
VTAFCVGGAGSLLFVASSTEAPYQLWFSGTGCGCGAGGTRRGHARLHPEGISTQTKALHLRR